MENLGNKGRENRAPTLEVSRLRTFSAPKEITKFNTNVIANEQSECGDLDRLLRYARNDTFFKRVFSVP